MIPSEFILCFTFYSVACGLLVNVVDDSSSLKETEERERGYLSWVERGRLLLFSKMEEGKNDHWFLLLLPSSPGGGGNGQTGCALYHVADEGRPFFYFFFSRVKRGEGGKRGMFLFSARRSSSSFSNVHTYCRKIERRSLQTTFPLLVHNLSKGIPKEGSRQYS